MSQKQPSLSAAPPPVAASVASSSSAAAAASSTPAARPTVQGVCPICSYDLSLCASEDEAHRHVNRCLGEETDELDDARKAEQAVFAAHPFAVLCPFAGCGRVMEAADFFAHAPSAHTEATHECPLCALIGNQTSCMLLSHLALLHGDLRGAGNPNQFHTVLKHKAAASAAAAAAATTATTAAAVAAVPKTPAGIRHVEHADLKRKGKSSSKSSAKKRRGASAAVPECGVCGAPQDGTCMCEVAVLESARASLVASLAALVSSSTMSIKSASMSSVQEQLSVTLETECIICFEEMEEGDLVTRLGCMCVFHASCLDQWYGKSQKQGCPTHRGE